MLFLCRRKVVYKVSNEEVNTIKGDVAEIKADVKQINTNFNDFRVFLSDTYVKKTELDSFFNKTIAVVTVITLIITAIGIFIK